MARHAFNVCVRLRCQNEKLFLSHWKSIFYFIFMCKQQKKKSKNIFFKYAFYVKISTCLAQFENLSPFSPHNYKTNGEKISWIGHTVQFYGGFWSFLLQCSKNGPKMSQNLYQNCLIELILSLLVGFKIFLSMLIFWHIMFVSLFSKKQILHMKTWPKYIFFKSVICTWKDNRINSCNAK